MRGAKIVAGIVLAVFVLLSAAATAVAQDQKSLEDLFKDIPSGGGTQGAATGNAASASTADTSGTANSAVAGAGITAAANTSPWSLSGDQTVEYHLPLFRYPVDYDGIYLLPRIENTFKLQGDFGVFRVYSSWRVDIYPLGSPSAVTGASMSLGAGNADLTVAPGENYISLGTGPLLVEAGYLIDQWGAADGLNPTNNINAVDYTRSLEPESIPSLMMRAVWYPVPSVGLEGVFEPYKRGDLFPVDPVSSIPSSLFSSSEISVSNPSVDLDSAVFGGRAAFYTSAADFSVSYLYDIDPYYTPEISYTSPVDKSLTLVHKRIHRIGADAKTTVGPFGLWAEACYSLTADPSMTSYEVRNPDLAWTVGGDVNYGPSDAFYLNFQYTGRYVFGFDRSFYTDYPGGAPDPTLLATDPAYATEYYARALSQSLGDQSEALLSGFILKMDFPFADSQWKPGFAAAYYLPSLYDSVPATRYGSLLLQPEIAWKPADSISVTLGADLMFAWKKVAGSSSIVYDTTDRIGMFHDQSNIHLTMKASW